MSKPTWIVNLADQRDRGFTVIVRAATQISALSKGRSALIRAQISADPRSLVARRMVEDDAFVMAQRSMDGHAATSFHVDLKGS